MKSRFLLPIIVFCLLPLAALAADFGRIVVFGDSLSDQGNLASVVGDFPQPPFYNNRVSNGPVAVEIMASELGRTLAPSLHLVGPASGTNYAVAAARARGPAQIDLGFQVELFLANHGGVAPGADVYVVFIGGNDVRDARGQLNLADGEAIVRQAASAVGLQVRRLIGAGARRILIANAPDVGSIPESSLIAALIGDPGFPARATYLSELYNNELKGQMHRIEEETGIDIEGFNIFKRLRKIIKKADKLGFTNTTDACFFTASMTFNPACDFERFVFFDEIHPTARVHAIIGKAMAREIREELLEEDEHEEEHEHQHEVDD